jgi:hypothetical protein
MSFEPTVTTNTICPQKMRLTSFCSHVCACRSTWTWAWTHPSQPGQPRASLLYRYTPPCTTHAILTVINVLLQMVIWGHPSTTGYHSIDYYLSSEKFHRHMYHHSTDAALSNLSSSALSRAVPYPYGYQFFLEQLVQFDTLGFYFDRPVLEVEFDAPVVSSAVAVQAVVDVPPQLQPLVLRDRSYYTTIRTALKKAKTTASTQLAELITRKLDNNVSIALCPQHMPKFHPHFDEVIVGILLRSPNSVIALVNNKEKLQWRRTITERWRKALTERITTCSAGDSVDDRQCNAVMANLRADDDTTVVSTVDDSRDVASVASGLLSRIVWLASLTPQEYVTMLAIGDVMLDPFPFGGGVTTLESVAVCTPVVTFPSGQSVPQLATGA